eukprot:15436409-Alexandrium_andersonii.AAC.1
MLPVVAIGPGSRSNQTLQARLGSLYRIRAGHGIWEHGVQPDSTKCRTQDIVRGTHCARVAQMTRVPSATLWSWRLLRPTELLKLRRALTQN